MECFIGMRRFGTLILFGLLGISFGCVKKTQLSTAGMPSVKAEESKTKLSISTAHMLAALRAGKLVEAGRLSKELLSEDPGNEQARLASALSGAVMVVGGAIHNLKRWMPKLKSLQLGDLLKGNLAPITTLWPEIETFLNKADRQLEAVISDLGMIQNPSFKMRLKPGAWEVDINQDGKVSPWERNLFQVEWDHNRNWISPKNRAQRMPIIAFDLGDIKWAMAKAGFLRAFLNFLLSYDFGKATFNLSGPRPGLVVPLRSKSRITGKVKQLLLTAIARAKEARGLISREKDNDQEWIPHPMQSHQHLPMAMTDHRFQAWGQVLDDLELIVKGRRTFSLDNINAGIEALIAFIRGQRGTVYLEFARSLYKGRLMADQPVTGFSLAKYLANPVDLYVDHAPVIAAQLLGGNTAKAILGERYLVDNMPRARFFELVLSFGKTSGSGAKGILSQMMDYRNVVRWLLYLF